MNINNLFKDKLITLRVNTETVLENFKYLLKTTAAEIYILGFLGASTGGYNSTRSELRRSEIIPLAFSESDQLRREASMRNEKLGPVMEYSLQLNDMCMKIMEAHNIAIRPFIPGTDNKEFIANLLDCMTLEHVHSEEYNLKDLLNNLPKLTNPVRGALRDYVLVNQTLPIINADLDRAWIDSHDDKYRTEIRSRTVTTTDANGNTSTTTEFYTEEVYDHTDHEYNYYKVPGELASKNLETLFKNIPTVSLDEKIIQTTVTNADGEDAAEKSRQLGSGVRLSEKDKLSIANLCVTGSTITRNVAYVNGQYPILHAQAKEWKNAKRTAHYESYRTYSHYDDGPIEFQVAESALSTGVGIQQTIYELFSTIDNTDKQLPILKSKITELLNISDSITGKERLHIAEKLEKDIMKITKNVYRANFKEGVNLDTFRWSKVALGILYGTLIGTATGAALNFAGDKFNIYDKINFGRKNGIDYRDKYSFR